jgi:hypothetical protein
VAPRAANALNVLLNQLNNRAPGRNKASDGWIGDADHQNRNSDHNPWYPPPNGGIVTARDFTHDPGGGLDCQWLASTLVTHNDPRIKYIIWNRRIWTPGVGWKPYTGANPHDHHLHLSVDANPSCDSPTPWAGITPAAPPPPKEVPDVNLNDPMRDYIWPHTANIKDTVGSTLANGMSYAKTSADTVARVEVRLAAMSSQLTDAQATLLAAIGDDETQVTLTPEQMQLFLNGVEEASARGLFEALKARFESQEG